jgi:hypothetical protein
MVYANESDPRKCDGDENPEVVGLAEAFLEVGAGGDKEVASTRFRYGGRSVFPLLHLETHHGKAESIDEADTEKDEGEVFFRFAEDEIVKEDAGNETDCSKDAVKSSQEGARDDVVD